MSFLTPKHFQDASRIFRGLALVAATAAAERYGGMSLFTLLHTKYETMSVKQRFKHADRVSDHHLCW